MNPMTERIQDSQEKKWKGHTSTDLPEVPLRPLGSLYALQIHAKVRGEKG